jgi:alkylresorcinol/alkylpyrone synthase
VVATALFGDGAAACVLKADAGPGFTVGAVGEHTWPDTLEIMGWRVDPAGLGVVLDANLPKFVERRFAEAAESYHRGGGPAPGQVGRFVCHPGGAKVLPAIEAALDLGEGALDLEREVLAKFGNMSAPTVFFVLERVLEARPPQRLTLAALGPGFTASFATLEAPHA